MDPCGLAEKLRDLVLDQILEQFLYLFCYGQNIEQLNEQLVKLTLQRNSLQHRVDVANNNADQIEEEVLNWLHKEDAIAKQAEQLHKESRAKRECSITSCPNPWLRYKLSKQAKAMAEEVKEIRKQGNFPTVAHRVYPQTTPELPDGESNEGLDSRVQIRNQILEALHDPNVNMIGLCGFGGVGKTTIAKDVGKNQNMFEKVIMAIVSDKLDVVKIQDQIAEKLGMQLDEKDEEFRAYRLCKRLEKEKNMLLILDDLWETLDCNKVGIPLINVGCKILLTSRNYTLLSDGMKCQKIIKVGVLSEDEAWELFKRIAKLSVDSSNSELIPIATEIVRKCGGLPLAIATAARALKNKALDEWKYALRRLNNPLRRNITGIREVDTILNLSYDHLTSSEYKHIFLLAAMLSHDLSIEELLMYSVGLNILQHTENMEDARVEIARIVSKLKALNLFLDSFSSRHVTIHDVFRDFALSIASKEFRAFIVRHKTVKEWPDENMPEDCKGICLQESDISVDLPEELHGPQLQFFMLNSIKRDLTIPSMFFKSSKELKVLAFTNVHFLLLPSLCFLKKLKTLCLHSCLLEDITEVKSLKKLKVLSLVYSEIQRLPIELVELTSLHTLNLSHCSKLKVIPPKILSSLKKLEVLYMGNSFDQWKVEGSSEANENASLDEIKDLPISSLDIHIPNVSMLPEDLFLDMNLERYKIFIGKHWGWWQVNYETSRTLKLELESSIDLKPGVWKLLEGVEDLSLYGSNGHENVLYSHDGRGFPRLKHLQIESNDDIKYIVLNSTHHEAAFPILESLILRDLKALEKLSQGPNAIVFPQLHTLRMKNLPALTADLCTKDRATNNVSNEVFKSLFNSKVLLPKIEILELSYLNHLIPLIWDEQLSDNSFSNLKILTVVSCGFVKLVPLHVLKSLNNLEELEVRECEKMEMVFDFEDLSDYKGMQSSSVVVPLKKLELWSLPKLKNVWSDGPQGIVSFPSLRSVEVCYCESLTSMFPASIAKGMLRHLEDLRISNCGIDVIVAKDRVLESVDAAFEFPQLTSLTLDSLPNLRNLQRHMLKWPRLQHLCIQNCDELEIFEKEVSSSSEIHEEANALNSKYPLLSYNEVIHHNLEELTLNYFPKVKLLDLSINKTVTISYASLLRICPNLESLELGGDFKETDGGDDVAALAPRLSTFTLYSISNMISLAPSLLSSPYLTHLHVTLSDKLTTLMTSSVARNLVYLTHLSISYCNCMEEIIKKQEGEDDDDQEIIFSKLKSLELHGLQRLKRFCGYNYTFNFPVLDQLTIEECPKFKTFSPGTIDTPSLKSVQLSKGWGEHHEIWDTNLDKTIYQQRFVASRELVLDEDDAILIRNIDQFPSGPRSPVEILRIKRIVDEGLAIPYALLERFSQLKALRVERCYFEEIFASHVPLSSASFNNLMELKVSECHQLVYLVTNSAAKCLANLETLEIRDCEKMEEVVRKESNEDVEGGITFNGLRILTLADLPRLKIEDEDKRDLNIEDMATNGKCRSLFGHNTVIHHNLEELTLKGKPAKMIGSNQFQMYHFPKVKLLHLSVEETTTISYASLLRSFLNLENMQLEGDFEETFGGDDVATLAPRLSTFTLESISNMISLAPSLLSSPNLTHLEVKHSNRLTILMTSSAARCLVHLTHLSISSCHQIEEIITKHEGKDDDEDKEIIFSKLKSLELDHLPRLKIFCGHNYTFKFPLLKSVIITECPQLTMFCLGAIHAPLLESIQMDKYNPSKNIWRTNLNDTIQHQFAFEEVISTTTVMALNAGNITVITDVFPEVRELYVESFQDEGATFPYSSLKRFPKMEELYVDHCFFEEIFPSQDHIVDFAGKAPPYEHDSQLPPIHQNLARLEVTICCNLVKLAPSSASFQNLERLKVSGCDQLIHLVTTSTAKSLVILRWLEIKDCKKMEEIVMNETNEDVQGAITFNQLRWIQLNDMPSLKMFSSQSYNFEFPELFRIQITGCPEMKMFCQGVVKTPKLFAVKIEDHDMEWKDGGDLNKIIETPSSAKDGINI